MNKMDAMTQSRRLEFTINQRKGQSYSKSVTSTATHIQALNRRISTLFHRTTEIQDSLTQLRMHKQTLLKDIKRMLPRPTIQRLPADALMLNVKIRPRLAVARNPDVGNDAQIWVTHQRLPYVVDAVVCDSRSDYRERRKE